MVRAFGLSARQAIALFTAIWLAGCDRPAKPQDGSVLTAGLGALTNETDPQWIHRDPEHPNRVAVVFVHGIFGDTKGTWTREGGPSFFDFVRQLPDIGPQLDIYAFGFASHKFANGSLKIGEAANTLHEYLKTDKVDKYEVIVFVAHSMGGLITMRELINHDDLRAKVPLLVFFATPHEGSQITTIGKHLLNNPALIQMLPVDANDYLQQVNEDWRRVANATPRPEMVCAYEKKPVAGAVVIVPWASSTRNCSQVPIAIEDSDHLSIVKPDRARHPSVIVLGNALNDYVAPLLSTASIDTPDFQKDSDPWVYRIDNAGRRNTAVLENRTSVPVSYSLEALDSTYMLIPQPMPRQVGAGGRDAVDMVLLSPLRPEYRLKLRIGATQERIVVARIPDMTVALAQRNELESATAEHINGFFATGDNKQQFLVLSSEQQQQKLSALAEEVITTRQPDLPGEARLVLTADTLNSLNFSQGAAATLSKLETRYPEAVKAASVKRLAGVVSARSGKARILETVEVPVVPAAEATPAPEPTIRTAEQLHALSELAEHLQVAPATRAEATLLRGDVLTSAGDSQAATRVYREAAQLPAAPPVTRERLRQSQLARP